MKSLQYYDRYQNMTQRHKVRKCYWKNDAHRLTPYRVDTNFQCIKKKKKKKNAASMKHNKAKCNKIRYACIPYYHVNRTPV